MKAALALLLMAAPAQAQQTQCFPFSILRDSLKARYHETAIGGGIVSGQVIIQVFASESGSTFTILAINTGGLACIISAGRDWQPGKLAEKGEPS